MHQATKFEQNWSMHGCLLLMIQQIFQARFIMGASKPLFFRDERTDHRRFIWVHFRFRIYCFDSKPVQINSRELIGSTIAAKLPM